MWRYRSYAQLDYIQNRAIRYFFGVHRFTPILAIVGKLGWLPSQYRRWLSILRFWNRLILMDGSRLTKQVFNFDYESGQNNWCREVGDIFDKLNLPEYFENKMFIDMSLASDRIYNFYANPWPEKCTNVPKLRTYIKFKTCFKTEKYLTLNLNRNERSIMTQFRCGVLPLRVETGRFVGKQVSDRICKMCNQGSVKDEIHFLVNCQYYTNLREHELGSVLNNEEISNKSEDDKLSILLNDYVRRTVKFLLKTFLRRRSKLYGWL